jgi:condensin complex subunit 2
VKIDFLTPSEKDLKAIKEELFAPPGKGQSINMAGAGTGRKGKKGKKDKSDHRLPDDMHFSSKQLVTLFLKPKFLVSSIPSSVQGRGTDPAFSSRCAESAQGWTTMTGRLTKTSGHRLLPIKRVPGKRVRGRTVRFWLWPKIIPFSTWNVDTDGHIPFSTQFFNDDDDDGPSGFGDFGDAGLSTIDADAGEQDLLAATAGQTRRIKPEVINYAKRAKRVDVRKLKENIWKGLDIVVHKAKPEGEDASMVSYSF